jgi:hypothetical protein
MTRRGVQDMMEEEKREEVVTGLVVEKGGAGRTGGATEGRGQPRW